METRGWHGQEETSNMELPMHSRYTMRREDRDVGGVSEGRLIIINMVSSDFASWTVSYAVMLHCF